MEVLRKLELAANGRTDRTTVKDKGELSSFIQPYDARLFKLLIGRRKGSRSATGIYSLGNAGCESETPYITSAKYKSHWHSKHPLISTISIFFIYVLYVYGIQY